jgi:hypothetical protein
LQGVKGNIQHARKQTTLKNYINLSDEIHRADLSILDTVELEQPV